jgi:aminoglycoside phosphotransferase family enzyme
MPTIVDATFREHFCKSELELNRRTAPSIYLRVRPVYRRADGRLSFDHGTIVDWVTRDADNC